MWWPKKKLDREIREEIEAHLALRAEWEANHSGTSDASAREQAHRQFGNTLQVQEEVRAVHVSPFVESIVEDVRYALRGFRRTPSFTVAALFALALGIGSSSAVFSVVDRVLFRDLPYPASDRLVAFGMKAPVFGSGFMTGPDYVAWRDAEHPFASMTASHGLNECDLFDGAAARLNCAPVDAGFFATFGVEPILGRAFTAAETVPGAPRRALISHALWQNRYAGDRQVIGRVMRLDGQPVTILGVMPRNFEFPTLERPDVLVSLHLSPEPDANGNMAVVQAFGRMKPGFTREQTRDALTPLFRQSLEKVPAQFRREVSLLVESLRERQSMNLRTASWVLFGAVLSVLLIACGNVAALMLARGGARSRELAVRAALGGGRPRLIRQLLTESLVLAALGAALGAGLGWAMLRAFQATAPATLAGRLQTASMDARVLAFTALVAFLSGILFGLWPALRVPRAEALAGTRASRPARGFLQQGLIALQFAACLVLLTGATLLIRTLWNLESVDLGVRAGNVLVAGVVLPEQFLPVQRHAFFESLEERVSHIPGVGGSAISDSIPSGDTSGMMIYSRIQVEGVPAAPRPTGGMVGWRNVTPSYFSALGIPVRQGRGFVEEDRRPGAEPVVILNQQLAQRMFPAGNAVGRHIRMGPENPWHLVVGICGNTRGGSLRDAIPGEYYLVRSHEAPKQPVTRRGFVILRSAGDPAALARAVRAEVAALDSTVPVEVEPLTRRFSRLADGPRFNAMLLALFAFTGLLLAVVGLYGVVAFQAGQRTREIGVRMALGARRRDIQTMLVTGVGRWLIAGAALGLLASWFAARMLRTLIFGISERDFGSAVAAVGLLLLAGAVASYLPARRAASTDPAQVLRYD